MKDILGTSVSTQGPNPTTGTAATGYINGQAVSGTMQSGIFTPNKP
jgi:hypothetical protein